MGKVLLTYSELQQALLDVEGGINNRLFCYQEENLDSEVLAPNILLTGKLEHRKHGMIILPKRA